MIRRLVVAGCTIGLLVCAARADAERSADATVTTQSTSARPVLSGVAIDEPLVGEPLLLPSLPRPVAGTPPPFIVRLAIGGPAGSAGIPSDAQLARLDQRLTAYLARNVRVVLSLGGFPEDDAGVERWRQAIRAVAERVRGRAAAYQIGEMSEDRPAPPIERYAFLLKLAAVQLRSVDSDALVIEGSVPAAFAEWQARLYAQGVAPYLDGVAVGGPSETDNDQFRAALTGMTSVVEREDPTAFVVLGPIGLSDQPDRASARLLESQIRSLGTSIKVTSYVGPPASIRSAVAVANRAGDLLFADLVTLDERAAGLRLFEASNEITERVPHRLLFSTSRFSTYLVYGGTSAAAAIDIDINIPNASAPMVRDVLTGTSEKPTGLQSLGGTRLRLTVPVRSHPLILDFNAGASDVFALSAGVQREALPTVGEIIFRHQQVQAAQDAVLRHYSAHMRLEQHFHPSPADPAYNVVTENRLFFDRASVEWEEVSFSLNGAKWTANRPAFPLVQPEKVLSLPLDLRLNQDYSYRLEGVDTLMGRPAYVIRFDPVTTGRALYRGTVWIDRELFVRLKVQAVETNLTGSIVSNEETQTFVRSGDGQGRPIWLLDRLSGRQVFLIAGRTVLIEREARLTDVVINSDAFEAERAAARSGDRIMYRDTDHGLRYLVKKGDTRVVSERMTTSATAFALGADVDPSFDFPLPIGGLDILDFNFLDKNMQLALLFGGVIALGNIQHPNLWGGRFDASVDFFGLAIKSNDSVFDVRGERTSERVRRIPASVGFNVGYQATPFQKVAAHYELRYDAYFRDENTAADFVVPASSATHGAGVGYEFRRGGYSVAANAMAYRRTDWQPWGLEPVTDPGATTYTRYDVGVSKDFIFATFHTIHVNGAYFGGERLDRFSMYQFGLFDSARMHGVPSAVRFGELAMFRGSYSFNVFDQYRVECFVDQAIGRNGKRENPWVGVTGLGLGFNLRGPRDTILRADIGKSFLPDAYRGAGSTVVQIMLLKPL